MQILLVSLPRITLMEVDTWLFRENAYFLAWYTRLFVILILFTFSILLVIYLFWVPVLSGTKHPDILETVKPFPASRPLYIASAS